jgi:hypothetical protein
MNLAQQLVFQVVRASPDTPIPYASSFSGKLEAPLPLYLLHDQRKKMRRLF